MDIFLWENTKYSCKHVSIANFSSYEQACPMEVEKQTALTSTYLIYSK